MEILRPLSNEEINDDPLTPLCNDSECIYCLRHRGANHSIPSTSTNLFRSYEEIADILNMQGTFRVDFLRFMKMEATQIPIAKETREIYERIRNLPSDQCPHKHVAWLKNWRQRTGPALGAIKRDAGDLDGTNYTANLGQICSTIWWVDNMSSHKAYQTCLLIQCSKSHSTPLLFRLVMTFSTKSYSSLLKGVKG